MDKIKSSPPFMKALRYSMQPCL